MKKASEYRQHAQACRQLAARMQHPDEREQLLRMAEQWEQLAKDRARLAGRTEPPNEDDEQSP